MQFNLFIDYTSVLVTMYAYKENTHLKQVCICIMQACIQDTSNADKHFQHVYRFNQQWGVSTSPKYKQ